MLNVSNIQLCVRIFTYTWPHKYPRTDVTRETECQPLLSGSLLKVTVRSGIPAQRRNA